MTERLVDVADGVQLCVDVVGSGPLLVLVHGAGCGLVAWPDGLVDLLARHHRVLRYDARDQGRSTTWPAGEPGYGMSDVVDDVLALVDDEGAETAHVLGVSDGGVVGQLLAIDHPARVASLTLVSSTPGSEGLPGMSDELRAFFGGDTGEPDWDDRDAVVAHLTGARAAVPARRLRRGAAAGDRAAHGRPRTRPAGQHHQPVPRRPRPALAGPAWAT